MLIKLDDVTVRFRKIKLIEVNFRHIVYYAFLLTIKLFFWLYDILFDYFPLYMTRPEWLSRSEIFLYGVN